MGLAYARFTMPNPTLAFFEGEHDLPEYASDADWELAWMRYGSGDWRTGWMASLLGDMLAAGSPRLFTVKLLADGGKSHHAIQWRGEVAVNQRPWRMVACGKQVICGFLSADNWTTQVRGEAGLGSAGFVLAVVDGASGAVRWKKPPLEWVPPPPLPPEPSDEFRPLADDFHLRPFAMVPFRAAMSVAAGGVSGRVACIEYGGYARIGQKQIHPHWSPRHPVWLCPPQQGWLRVFGEHGEEVACAMLPQPGLFEEQLSGRGDVAWCGPMSWFARGLAGCPWLPADPEAVQILRFDLRAGRWVSSWRFADTVADFAVHPSGESVLVSCWDGWLYLVGCDGRVIRGMEVGGPGRVRCSADGRFAVIGTQEGGVCRVDEQGRLMWRTRLPVRSPKPLKAPLAPAVAGVPVYRVGRVGPEHAYVGDIWLIKAPQGAILVDAAGTSAIADTWQRIQAAGIDPRSIRYLLLSHTHGDHLGAAYLWRSLGLKVVAPAPAALPATWMVPTLSHYGIWVPCVIDMALPLARPGDTTRFVLDGLDFEAILAPGHSVDTAVYVLELAGKRVILTGDIAFRGRNHILDRCWGDVPKARAVIQILRERVLPLRPEVFVGGHDARDNAARYWEEILRVSEEAVARAGAGER